MKNKRAGLPIWEQLSEAELMARYPHEITGQTSRGTNWRVRYRRITVRDGFDIDAISLPPDYEGARGQYDEEGAK